MAVQFIKTAILSKPKTIVADGRTSVKTDIRVVYIANTITDAKSII